MAKMNATMRKKVSEVANARGEVEEGKYRIKLASVTAGMTKDKQFPQWTVLYKVVGSANAEYKGREIKDFLTFKDSVMWRIDAFLKAFDLTPDDDTDDALGREAMAELFMEEFNGNWNIKIRKFLPPDEKPFIFKKDDAPVTVEDKPAAKKSATRARAVKAEDIPDDEPPF